jgi:hypothetical protein
MVQEVDKNKENLMKSISTTTEDDWVCCMSQSTDYVNIVVRCNDLDAVVYFSEHDSFSAGEMQNAIDKILFYYYSISGNWKRSIITWLFEVFHEYIDNY